MAKFSRIEVALTMQQTGFVPVFYHPEAEVCKRVIQACYKGGARVFEFTNRGDFAHETFAILNKWVTTNLPDMILGVGSIVDEGAASLYMQLGVNFVVSPLLSSEVARCCNYRKLLWIPGCGTVTEIHEAHALGAEIVKIFPGSSVGGPAFVKAVKGPCPWCSIMPTGGVEPTEENLVKWFDAGVTCVGLGSNLFPKAAVEEGNYDLITQKVQEVVGIINRQRLV